MDEPAEARTQRGHSLTVLMREDLEAYAVEELRVRISVLEGEIQRCREQIARKEAGRAAADALFSRRVDPD